MEKRNPLEDFIEKYKKLVPNPDQLISGGFHPKIQMISLNYLNSFIRHLGMFLMIYDLKLIEN